MSIRSVESTIRHVRAVVKEWDEAGFGYDNWREEHTRYAIIDPLVSALGWNTADPKECHPEYWRFGDKSASGRAGRVDYALFHTGDLEAIGNGSVPPNIIIEAKALNVGLDAHVDQLREYVEAEPYMTKGVAVLTNGQEWWLYDVSRRDSFPRKRADTVNVMEDSLRETARSLNECLDRRRFS